MNVIESQNTQSVFFNFFDSILGQSCVERLESGALGAQNLLILTPNDRLATRLNNAFNLWAQAQHLACYVAPECISLNRWAVNAWRTFRYAVPSHHPWAGCFQLSEPAQEDVVWSAVLESDKELDVLDANGLITLAAQAYRIQRSWIMSESEIAAHATGDQLKYVQWQARFVDVCRAQGLLPQADLLAVISQCERPPLFQYERCIWLGFSELTPVESHLFECFATRWSVAIERTSLRHFMPEAVEQQEALGAGIPNETQPNNEDSRAFVFAAQDESEQTQTALQWLLAHYAPDAKLALVVPDLPTRRAELEAQCHRIWAHTLAPGALLELPDANLSETALAQWANFSGGQALSKLPIYQVVVAVVEMSFGLVTLNHVLTLLQSDYLNVKGCLDKHLSELYAQFQCLEYKQWPLSGALSLWHKTLPEGLLDRVPQWTQAFKSCQQILLDFEAPLDPERLMRALACWGWPGSRVLDSVEYQQFQKLPAVLDQWRRVCALSVSLQGTQNDRTRPGRDLLKLLDEQIFQPQSKETPLQVLGILEALEQPFDALWFFGAHDEALPPPARPHPLLPLSLQRHYKSLRATPARELGLAREVVHAFKALCKSVCFSWPAREGAKVFAPSPLIQDLPPFLQEPTPSGPVFEEKSLELKTLMERQASAVDNIQSLRGGTSLLKTFAQCPFKAFVRYRLQLNEPPTQSTGLTPLARGHLAHTVLEGVWKAMLSQSELKATAPAQLEQRVSTLVNDAITKQFSQKDIFLAEVLLSAEAQRLTQLVLNWLEYEKARSPFRIEAIEHSVEFTLEGLPLKLRLDRMDALEDDRLCVIDYKTGSADMGQLFGPRIESPQLPLYCMAVEAKGVAFALLRSDKPQLKGFFEQGASVMEKAKDARSIKAVDDWPSVLARWSDTLAQTVKIFLNGLATIDPVQGETTCQQCAYASICRINSQCQ